MKRAAAVLALGGMILATSAVARDRLGVWNDWGAFRDAGVPRCYAIAMAADQPGQRPSRGSAAQPFVTVADWPRRNIHGEVHVRLPREPIPGRPVLVVIGTQRFTLVSSGSDAWSADRRTDAAIIAALRSSGDMTVFAHDRNGRPMRDTYRLAGAASAMDAASLGCAASG
jgi:hypothetical protein